MGLMWAEKSDSKLVYLKVRNLAEKKDYSTVV